MVSVLRELNVEADNVNFPAEQMSRDRSPRPRHTVRVKTFYTPEVF